MKVKKLAALALACAVVAASGAVLAACNGNGGNEDDKKGGYVEDTRIWYAVGNSEKGTLKDNGWKPQVVADSLKFTKDTTKTDENVYTLKMDIYAGDGFKFLYKNTADETFASDDEIWARQVGIYNFDNVSGEGKDAVIKVGEDTLFTTKDGIDANNLYCAKGQDGKYTITLKTFPGDGAQEKVQFSITKDEAITIPYDMYVFGDMNDFGWKNKADYAMTSSNGVWSYKLNITAEDLTRDATGAKVQTGAQYAAIQINNEGDDELKKTALTPAEGSKILKVTDKDKGDINLLPAGKWVITFTEEGKVVAITESAYEMYIIGTVNDWKENDEEHPLIPMTEQANGTWTANITVEKAEEIKSFNKLGLPNQKYSDGANVALSSAGTWAVKYNPDTNTIEVEKCEYYIVGGYTDPVWGDGLTANKSVKLIESATAGTYTGEVELKAGTEFKIVLGSVLVGPKDWYGAGENGGDPNFKATEDGTYVVTVVVTNGAISSATFAKK